MLILWLCLCALSVSPELHQRLHHDFSNLNHECLLTLLTKGQLLIGQSAVIEVSIPLLDIDCSISIESSPFLTADYRQSPSRAPPLAVPSSAVVG